MRIRIRNPGTGTLSSKQSPPDVASLRHEWANDSWAPDWTWTWLRTPHTCTALGVQRTRASAIFKNLVILKSTLAHGPLVALLLFHLLVQPKAGIDKKWWSPIKRRGHEQEFISPLFLPVVADPDPYVSRPSDPLIRGTDPDPSTELWLLYDFLSLKNYVNVALKSTVITNKPKKFRIFFCCLLEGYWRKQQDPEPDPNPIVRGTDPRIRIRTKMSRTRNTAVFTVQSLARGVVAIGILKQCGHLNRNNGRDPWIRIRIKTLRIRETDEIKTKIRPIGMAGTHLEPGVCGCSKATNLADMRLLSRVQILVISHVFLNITRLTRQWKIQLILFHPEKSESASLK